MATRPPGRHPGLAHPNPVAPRRPAGSAGGTRLTIRRVRLRSVARVGCSLGWLISLLPAIALSALATWVLHGIWSTLNGWVPWSPWPPDTRIGPIVLPTPVFRPREALQVEGLYQLLEPVGRHPIISTLAGAVALTFLGGLLLALIFLLAGAGYNAFARFTGGIELELARQPDPSEPYQHHAPGRPRPDALDWQDDSRLEW